MRNEYQTYENDRSTTETMAIALGWFSCALGIAELVAPRQVSRLIGAPLNEATAKTLRAYGAREIASGIAILSDPKQARWLWSRVGGDALDLASLGAAARYESSDPSRLAVATAAVAGVAALDVITAIGLQASSRSFNEFGVNVANEQAITIKAPLEAVENAWVEWCAGGHSHLRNDYAIRFEPAPAARGTEVHLAGGGSAGKLREELRRFKQLLETGEIPLSDGPSLWRPAQPRAREENPIAEVRS
jgi:uncharacterized protein YjeT (DUF2065 family)